MKQCDEHEVYVECPASVPARTAMLDAGMGETSSIHCWAGPEFELRLESAIIVLRFVATTPIRNPLQ